MASTITGVTPFSEAARISTAMPAGPVSAGPRMRGRSLSDVIRPLKTDTLRKSTNEFVMPKSGHESFQVPTGVPAQQIAAEKTVMKQTAGLAVASEVAANIAHKANLVAQERIHRDKIYRGLENDAFVSRLQSTIAGVNTIRASLANIDNLERQAGGTRAGQQRQLFLRDSMTGGRV